MHGRFCRNLAMRFSMSCERIGAWRGRRAVAAIGQILGDRCELRFQRLFTRGLTRLRWYFLRDPVDLVDRVLEHLLDLDSEFVLLGLCSRGGR